jgi:hypothetical protein
LVEVFFVEAWLEALVVVGFLEEAVLEVLDEAVLDVVVPVFFPAWVAPVAAAAARGSANRQNPRRAAPMRLRRTGKVTRRILRERGTAPVSNVIGIVTKILYRASTCEDFSLRGDFCRRRRLTLRRLAPITWTTHRRRPNFRRPRSKPADLSHGRDVGTSIVRTRRRARSRDFCAVWCGDRPVAAAPPRRAADGRPEGTALARDEREAPMSLVRLIGFCTLPCGCLVGRYREVASARELVYVEEKGGLCTEHGHRRNHTIPRSPAPAPRPAPLARAS